MLRVQKCIADLMTPLDLPATGFEQANRYSIKNMEGQVVGYIAEEDGLGKSLIRNIMRLRRPFNATVMDALGNVVLKVSMAFRACMPHMCCVGFGSFSSHVLRVVS
mgnify:CR=1 FL=1